MSEAFEIRSDIDNDLSGHIAKLRLLREMLGGLREGFDLKGSHEEREGWTPGDGLHVIIDEIIVAFDETMGKLDKRVSA